MTTSPTLSTLLFADRPHPADTFEPAVRAAAQHAAGPDVTTALNTIAGHIAADELEAALDRACGTPVADLLLRGWRVYAALDEAARQSLDDVGGERPVSLAKHCITAEQHPEIDVLIAGVPALTVHLALTARLDITDVVAVVASGALVELRAGYVDTTVSLSAEDVPIATATERFAIDEAFPLPRPIPIRTGAGR